MEIKRGEIYFVNLGKREGSVQSGVKPFLIISNNIGNKHAPIVSGLVITSKKFNRAKMPTHVILEVGEGGVRERSNIMAEQITTISKTQIQFKIGELKGRKLQEVENSILLAMGIVEN